MPKMNHLKPDLLAPESALALEAGVHLHLMWLLKHWPVSLVEVPYRAGTGQPAIISMPSANSKGPVGPETALVHLPLKGTGARAHPRDAFSKAEA